MRWQATLAMQATLGYAQGAAGLAAALWHAAGRTPRDPAAYLRLGLRCVEQ